MPQPPIRVNPPRCSAWTVRGTPAPACTRSVSTLVARRPKNLNPRRRVERLGVGLRGALADNAHVELHRSRIPMDLHDRHLRALGVDVLVESEQAWLARLDELNESWHAAALSLVGVGLEPVCSNEDERA